MTRNPLNFSSEARAKNATRTKRRDEAGYHTFSLGVSFVLGAISLGWVLWQRISGNTYLNIHAQSFNSVTSFYPGLQSSSYGIQFPGLTTLVVSSALAYQSGNPLLGLLSGWTLYLTSPVNAQALPAIIDFNTSLTMNLGCTVQGGAGSDLAGWSVAAVGDVNGDGKSDFLVGAYGASPAGRFRAGAAYLIYGRANLPAVINLGNLTQGLGVVMQGGAALDFAGWSIAAAGDVNGDGKSDFLVGAYDASTAGRSGAGAAYLIYGGANLPAVIDLGNLTQALGVVMQGGAPGDGAGYSVAGAGDVNGDGKSDFLAGAASASPAGRSNAGAAYLIYGGTNLPPVIDLGSLTQALGVVMQGGAADDYAGTSVAAAGDVNDDGKSDFLVGAENASPAGLYRAGAAYLIYGGANLPAVIDLGSLTQALGVVMQGGAGGDNTGWSVAGAGDVNGDGKSDFLVGAWHASPVGRSQAGAAYLIYGGANLPTFIDLGNLTQALGVIMQGGAANDNAGTSVAAAGDVNDDGKSDFLVGANGASPAGRNLAGAAYLIYGGANLPAVINLGSITQALGVVMQGGATGDRAGISVASAGDVNGDGGLDMLVGAYDASPAGRSHAGDVYVVYGPPSNRSFITTQITTSSIIVPTTTTTTRPPSTLTATANPMTVATNGATTLAATTAAVTTPSGMTPTAVVTTQPTPPLGTILSSLSASLTTSEAAPQNTGPTQSIMPSTSPSSTTPSVGAPTGSSLSGASASTTPSLASGLSVAPKDSMALSSSTSSSTNLTPIIAGAAAGGGLALAACLAAGIGFFVYRKKHKLKSASAIIEKSPDNRYAIGVANNGNEDVALQSVRDSAEKYEAPKLSTHLSNPPTSARANYGKIDEFKKSEKEYDLAPIAMGDDLNPPTSTRANYAKIDEFKKTEKEYDHAPREMVDDLQMTH